MNSRIATSILVTLLVIVAAAAGVWWYLSWGNSNQQKAGEEIPSLQVRYKTNVEAVGSLMEENSAFVRGSTFQGKSQYAEAAQQYEIALNQTNDVSERGIIKFRLAIAYQSVGDYADAISIWKGIAADTSSYSRITRAEALQSLALMNSRFGDPKNTELIFSDPPYSALLAKGNEALSYRHLFEYTTTVYPVALSEFYIADWYAGSITKIVSSGDSSTTTASTISSYNENIKERLAAGEKDLSRMRQDPSEQYNLVYSLERKAVVLGKMELIGDTSFGESAEAAFKATLAEYSTLNISADGTARLQYVYFLARKYGKTRAMDIKNILAPIYQDTTTYRGASIKPFLTNARTHSDRTEKNLVLLASLDSNFKALLVSFGWTEADFK